MKSVIVSGILRQIVREVQKMCDVGSKKVRPILSNAIGWSQGCSVVNDAIFEVQIWPDSLHTKPKLECVG